MHRLSLGLLRVTCLVWKIKKTVWLHSAQTKHICTLCYFSFCKAQKTRLTMKKLQTCVFRCNPGRAWIQSQAWINSCTRCSLSRGSVAALDLIDHRWCELIFLDLISLKLCHGYKPRDIFLSGVISKFESLQSCPRIQREAEARDSIKQQHTELIAIGVAVNLTTKCSGTNL